MYLDVRRRAHIPHQLLCLNQNHINSVPYIFFMLFLYLDTANGKKRGIQSDNQVSIVWRAKAPLRERVFNSQEMLCLREGDQICFPAKGHVCERFI